jgi:hypothetical protein
VLLSYSRRQEALIGGIMSTNRASQDCLDPQVWMGKPGTRTRAHYDNVHNFYIQASHDTAGSVSGVVRLL